MSKVFEALRSKEAYIFLVVGVVWLAVALNIRSYLVLWPVITCVLSGALIKVRPGERLTWAWSSSTACLGLILSGYQAYVAALGIGGAFSSIASVSLAGFSVFAVVHILLLYAGNAPTPQPI